MPLAAEVLDKQPGETINYGMDFDAALATDEIIDSIVVTHRESCGGTADLEMEDLTNVISADGKSVSMLISGGTSGKKYIVTVVATTSEDQVLEGDGILRVKDI